MASPVTLPPMSYLPQVTAFDAASILIVLAAALGYLNLRLLRLPQSVGLTIMGAVASLLVVAFDSFVPGAHVGVDVVRFLNGIDFHRTLMEGMLSFLLFAGALHVDWRAMQRGRWPVLVLSTLGVLFSTMLIGWTFHLLATLLGLAVPLAWCFVFGALISPTDPVAVLGVLKRTDVGPALQATVAGESLFNDGVGVVVFTILLEVALGTQSFSPGRAAGLFVLEAGGGVALGLAIGWIAYAAIRSIDDYEVEVMLTLAVVMGGYTVARWLHVSGPVAMVVAGLVIGNGAVVHAMSARSREYLLKFWAVIDDVLNAVLFLLIGLETLTVPADIRLITLGLVTIPLVLAVRAVSVLLPLAAMRSPSLGRLAPITLIWGGLRGGISVALALGLPDGPARPLVLAATYLVVLFSVIVQGGTIERVLRLHGRRPA